MEFNAKVSRILLCLWKNPDSSEHEALFEQHKLIPGSMEISDETLHKEAGNDMTKV